VRPAAPNGARNGRLLLDHAEMRLRYWMSP